MEEKDAINKWHDLISEGGSVEDSNLDGLSEETRAELKELESMWHLMDDIDRPEPSEQMDARFDGMMAAYKSAKKEYSASIFDMISAWFFRSWQVGLAALVVGVLGGWWLLPSQEQKQDLAQLSGEIQDMKEMMMLTLMEQPKAQERIRAVSLVSEMSTVDDHVVNSLVSALNTDDNVNVRLAALESLVNYGKLPVVRSALIASIQEQESALLQVSIADALVLIQAKNSIGTLDKLNETIEDDLVKEKLNESIKNLKSI